MMAAKIGNSAARPAGPQLFGLYVVALTSTLLGNLLVRMGQQGGWLPAWAQVALAIASVAPLVVAATMFWRLLRGELDEMLQRIVLEGMAFALIIFIPLSALYLNMRTAGLAVPRLDPPEIVLGPAILVAFGILIARRRYE